MRSIDGVPIHELNPDPDDERPAGRRAAQSQTRRDVSGDYYAAAAKSANAGVLKRDRSMSKATLKDLGRDALGRRIIDEDE